MFQPVIDTMNRAVSDGVFPGAVLLIHAQGNLVFLEAFGHASLLPDTQRMTTDTVFDVASLTKPLITTTLILTLIAEGNLELDEPVSTYVPSWNRPPNNHATIRHLLTHTSGLPAWKPIAPQLDSDSIATSKGKERIIESVEREPLVAEPGTRNLYSDLGFILLGAIVERIAKQGLDQVAATRLCRPLNLRSSFFLPVANPHLEHRAGDVHIAATAACPWRRRILLGEVDDDNAYAMGGVAGHAGWFSDAHDVYDIVTTLQDARLGKSPFLPAHLIEHGLTRQAGLRADGWVLGWMVPTPPSSSGQYFSSRSFGHLGFTGTSIWVDPDCDLVVVLLTNRVHPDRRNEALTTFRPVIHDVIYETVIVGSRR